MSQQLTFTLISKKDPTFRVDLRWYSTTPARILSTEDIFPYTDKELTLSESDLHTAYEGVQEVLKEATSYIEVVEKNKKELNTLLLNASTEVAAKSILDSINKLNADLKYTNDRCAEWENYMEDIGFISSVYQDNKEEWNLVYSNC